MGYHGRRETDQVGGHRFFYRELEIDESQLVGVGLGEEQAFADNTTETGRQQNRRAMLQLMNVMEEG